MRILLLNGPPRSGKDTLADLLAVRGYRNEKFALPLVKAVPALFAVRESRWNHMYLEEKEQPQPELQGMTPRQAMIWVSEEVMKPPWGKDIYGKLALRRMNPGFQYAFSDSGFAPEAQVLLDAYGPEDITLVRLHRRGCSFRQDSRNYIELDCPTYDLDNNAREQDLLREMDALLNTKGGPWRRESTQERRSA